MYLLGPLALISVGFWGDFCLLVHAARDDQKVHLMSEEYSKMKAYDLESRGLIHRTEYQALDTLTQTANLDTQLKFAGELLTGLCAFSVNLAFCYVAWASAVVLTLHLLVFLSFLLCCFGIGNVLYRFSG